MGSSFLGKNQRFWRKNLGPVPRWSENDAADSLNIVEEGAAEALDAEVDRGKQSLVSSRVRISLMSFLRNGRNGHLATVVGDVAIALAILTPTGSSK